MIITAGTPVCNAKDPPLDSLGNPARGSIGGAVYDTDGNIYLITCYHCVINADLSYDQFVPGNGNDNVNGYAGGQPFSIGQIINAKRDGSIDLAVIKPDLQNNQVDFSIPNIGMLTGPGVLTPNDQNIVQLCKYGAVTDFTKGTYADVAPSTGALYPFDNSPHYLTNLLMVSGNSGYFSDVGDSGSFVVNSQNKMVGMIVMCDGSTSYAINTVNLLNYFSFTFSLIV